MPSAWEEWKKSLGDTRPWDLLNPNSEHCTHEEQKARMDICNGCPELIELTKQCKKCGCVMPLKTKLKTASCPMGKW